MSGKYRICLPTIISLLMTVAAFATGPEEGQKSSLTVNGYFFREYGVDEIEGLRSKAVADLFYLQGSISRSVQYYEIAARKIPNEADIYLRLGDIYNELNVQTMALSYYRMAVEKYVLPENAGKSAKYRYLAMIRLARTLENTRTLNNGHEEADKVIAMIQKDHEQNIKSQFPEVYSELLDVKSYVIGNVIVPPR